MKKLSCQDGKCLKPQYSRGWGRGTAEFQPRLGEIQIARPRLGKEEKKTILEKEHSICPKQEASRTIKCFPQGSAKACTDQPFCLSSMGKVPPHTVLHPNRMSSLLCYLPARASSSLAACCSCSCFSRLYLNCSCCILRCEALSRSSPRKYCMLAGPKYASFSK